MMKYFINYIDLKDNNKINKDISFDGPNVYIVKKKRGDLYSMLSPYMIGENLEILEECIKSSNFRRGLLMVELTKEEADLFDSLLITTFEQITDFTYKMLSNEKEYPLLGFRTLFNLNQEELKRGSIIILLPYDKDSEYLTISVEKSIGINDNINKRKALRSLNICSDIYFYTEDETLLEKYHSDISTLIKIDKDKYTLHNLKLFVLNSLNSMQVYDMNVNTYKLFDKLSYNSTPVSIKEQNGKYFLDLNLDPLEKKGYVINNVELYNMFCNGNLEPLLRHINVFIYSDKSYKKISLEEYLIKNKMLKYMKKNET